MFETTDENMKILTAMSNAGIQSRFISEFNMIEMLIDTPANTIQGFIVNLKCAPAHVNGIFYQEDHGIVFKDNNLWLFIDDDRDKQVNESIVNVISQVIELRKMIIQLFDEIILGMV